MTREALEQTFVGKPVSGGIAIGPLYVLSSGEHQERSAGPPNEELKTFRSSVAKVRSRLEDIVRSQDKLAADILEFQVALLEDDELLKSIEENIASGSPAHLAWCEKLDQEISEYRASGAEYLAARADDLADLRIQVLQALSGIEMADIELADGTIILVADLTPSAFLDLDWSRIGGVATLGGSATSHVSILARARGVNLVVGLKAQLDGVPNGEIAVLDAVTGSLLLHPNHETLSKARAKAQAARADEAEIRALARAPASTADGHPIKVLVNIDDPSVLSDLDPDIFDGVGLTRTEFLFKSGHLPNEDEQYTFYSRLIRWAKGRPVTIRTLDAGGDKPIPGVTIDGERNPFLGVRGLRLSLARPDLFKVQLRALARAAALGSVKVMFPMVTAPWEMLEARGIMASVVAALEKAGVGCAMPEMGMMVEVPAAALTAINFDADFYSVGSNDLVQYTTASARDNDDVSTLFDPKNPAVIELIHRTVEAGRSKNAEVSLCGDMASSPEHVSMLLSAGLRVLSCAPAQIGHVKRAIGQCRITGNRRDSE